MNEIILQKQITKEIRLKVIDCICGGNKIHINYNEGSYGYYPPNAYIYCDRCGLQLSERKKEYEKEAMSIYLVEKWNAIMRKK